MVAEREVTYQVNGQPVTYKYRRLRYGEYQQIMGSIGQVELVGGVTRSKVDTTKMIDELMKKAVSGAVDFHELDMVDGLDLQEKVLEFNGMGGNQPSFRPES
jgi:hypothetical protein